MFLDVPVPFRNLSLSVAFDQIVARLAGSGPHTVLGHGLKGLEKESLRVGADGAIARTPHPLALGSALTHEHITTDYSEALLEFITPPYPETAETLAFLDAIHRFAYANLDGEALLGASMPCGIKGDDSIPIARYGSSNIGHMKYVYRVGLAHRYGRTMQAIAGIHFNYSVPVELWPWLQEQAGDRRSRAAFTADAYFGMIRNILRHGWLVLYLFGASPAICRAFFHDREQLADVFDRFDADTYYKPYATSLRMSDIGYKNRAQATLDVSFDSLEAYVASLGAAIATPSAEFQQIGVKVNGEYRQLNANVLQIENEYYNSVRPKQIAQSGEKPSLALKRRGIRYVELRSVDLNPFQPAGVGLDDLRFLETFLLFCLLEQSAPLSSAETAAVNANMGAVAGEGRRPGLRLQRAGQAVELTQWAEEICDAMAGLCELLDRGRTDGAYGASLRKQVAKIRDAEQTPSAQVLAEMRSQSECFGAFALRWSRAHAARYLSQPLDEELTAYFRRLAEKSLDEQRHIETENRLSFDDFLRNYFAQDSDP